VQIAPACLFLASKVEEVRPILPVAAKCHLHLNAYETSFTHSYTIQTVSLPT
jgi:hypothetical protein